MTEGIETSHAAREASGARQYGRYLEEFEVGAVYKHWPAKTVTEADDHLFCLLTRNHHPLHINDVYAAESPRTRLSSHCPVTRSCSRSASASSPRAGSGRRTSGCRVTTLRPLEG